MAEKPASRSDAEIVVVRTNDAALPTRSPNADPETVDMRLLRTIEEARGPTTIVVGDPRLGAAE